MRISLADSRSNGFKKWSDAQPPARQPAPPDTAAPEPEADLVRPAESIGGERE